MRDCGGGVELLGTMDEIEDLAAVLLDYLHPGLCRGRVSLPANLASHCRIQVQEKPPGAETHGKRGSTYRHHLGGSRKSNWKVEKSKAGHDLWMLLLIESNQAFLR